MRKYSVNYTDEEYQFLLDNAPNHTIKELVKMIKGLFDKDVQNKKLAQYCIKMGIKYKYENPKKSHSNKPTPIGTIVNKTDGDMLKIKTGNHKWEYLQRKIYEKEHDIKLKNDEYVLFLDQDKRNFDKENLKLVTRQESALLSKGLVSNDAEVTKTAIQTVQLINKVKNKKNRVI